MTDRPSDSTTPQGPSTSATPDEIARHRRAQTTRSNVSYLELMGVPIRPAAEDAESRLWRAEERIERLERALDGVAAILEDAGLWSADA